MDAILNFDARIWGLALFAVMSFAWLLGRHMLMDPDYDQPKTTSKIEEAGMALFGLLVAFCFAGAADRYEGRKALLLHDAISIGDFATTASTLQEPARTAIHNELVRYVEQRLAFGKIRFGGPEMPGRPGGRPAVSRAYFEHRPEGRCRKEYPLGPRGFTQWF